jgi:hypothetical protein
MKKSELRQIIREEYNKITNTQSIKEQQNTGLITFEQLKQACIESYNEYLNPSTDDSEIYNEVIGDLGQATNVDELVNMLDGRGFNGNEAYNFIFGSILK